LLIWLSTVHELANDELSQFEPYSKLSLQCRLKTLNCLVLFHKNFYNLLI